MQSTKRKTQPEEIEAMHELYAEGLTINKISKVLGLGDAVVRRRLDPVYARSCWLRNHHKNQELKSLRTRYVVRSRDRRQARPRLVWPSFSAWFLGDPAQGRSVLDRFGPRQLHPHVRGLTPDEKAIDSFFRAREHAREAT